MLGCQIADREEVFLNGNREAVQSCNITFVKLVVFLKEKFIILEDSEVQLFLTAEDCVDPIAVRHIHWLNEERLHNIVVDFWGFPHNLLLLTSVLCDQVFRGGIYDVRLDLAELTGQFEPEFAPLIIVEILLVSQILVLPAFHDGK